MNQQEEYPAVVQQKLDEIKTKGGVTTYSEGPYTYILLATGERPTGGYRIDVLDVKEAISDGQEVIKVRAKEIQPAPGAFVIQVITYPTAVYRIPRTTKPIQVEWARYD